MDKEEIRDFFKKLQQESGFESGTSTLVLISDHEKYKLLKDGKLEYLIYGLIGAMKNDPHIFGVIVAALKGLKECDNCGRCKTDSQLN